MPYGNLRANRQICFYLRIGIVSGTEVSPQEFVRILRQHIAQGRRLAFPDNLLPTAVCRKLYAFIETDCDINHMPTELIHPMVIRKLMPYLEETASETELIDP